MSRFQDCAVDAAIVARARRGDAKAHEILYRTFSVPVYTLACRVLQRPEAAEEILQETFVEVLRHIGTFRGEAPLGAWIRSIAVNKCLMQLRSAWTRYARALEPEVAAAAAARDDCGPAAQVRGDLEQALARLTPTARTVVWLYDVEGYTHSEIGALMGKTTSFSKSQLARAHQRLRELLDETDDIEPCMQASTSC